MMKNTLRLKQFVVEKQISASTFLTRHYLAIDSKEAIRLASNGCGMVVGVCEILK